MPPFKMGGLEGRNLRKQFRTLVKYSRHAIGSSEDFPNFNGRRIQNIAKINKLHGNGPSHKRA